MTKRRKPIDVEIGVEASSGNVVGDLGLPNPDLEFLKAGLMLEIHRIVKARKLTQASVGTILGIHPSHVSDLIHGRARDFSVERLVEFLAALGYDVEVRATLRVVDGEGPKTN